MASPVEGRTEKDQTNEAEQQQGDERPQECGDRRDNRRGQPAEPNAKQKPVRSNAIDPSPEEHEYPRDSEADLVRKVIVARHRGAPGSW